MAEQEQNTNVNDEFGETSKSPPSKNTTFHSFNNSDASQFFSEYSGFNQNINDPVKYMDMQRMLIEQGNAMMTLKISEYEKVLAERDYTIKNLHTDMMNSQNNNFVLSNQYQNIMEKTQSVSDTCVHLNTNFTSICERLNRLGDTVDNARSRQKDVVNLVDQTTNTFQEKILNITYSIEESLKQVNIEKIRTKQELEVLENKYSLNLIAHKTNLEEYSHKIEILKSENNSLLEKLNEANIKLHQEKETVLGFSSKLEQELQEIKNQNELLINENKLANVKYDNIIIENQSLMNELATMKISLDEYKIQFELQLNINNEQTELFNNIKISEELNNTLQKENLDLKEHNKQLEKNNIALMDDNHNNKLSLNEIQENNEKRFKEMCTNYDLLLKMHEEKLLDMTNKLEFQKGNENMIQNEIINLKQENEMSNKTIINLQEEIKANYILIPELQNKVDNLNIDLINSNKKLQDFTNEFMIKQNELENEKNEYETQSKEHFKQIEKLTANYMKYKSKAKQLYVEVLKLRFQCSKSEKKKTFDHPSALETIEIMSDEEEYIDDASIVEYNDQNVSNMNASIQSTNSKLNKKTIDHSTLKRNSSPLNHINLQMKKRKISVDNAASQATIASTKILKQKNDFQQIEKSLNSSMKNINLKQMDIDYNKTEENVQYNPIIKDYSQNKMNLTISPQQENYDLNSHGQNSIKSIPNAASNPNIKKMFKIPADLKPPQKKKKPINMQNKNDWHKPNSPVIITNASPQKNIPHSKVSRK